MPSSSNLYTLGIMEKVTASMALGSVSSGYLIQDLADFNPDTWVQFTYSGGSIIINFDFQEAVTPTQFFLWLKDYDTDYEDGSNNAIVVESCDDDDGLFTPATVFATAVYMDNDVGDPIYFPFSTITGSRARRYWRVSFTSLTATLKISQIGFVVTRAISVGNLYPEEDQYVGQIQTIKGHGGRTFRQLTNRNYQIEFQRKYILNGTTDYNNLVLAWIDCKYGAIPLVCEEGSTKLLCNLTGAKFIKRQPSYNIYDATMSYETIPYVEDGENY